MPNAADARRRWFGLFFLIVAGGLLIWGQTVLRPHLRGLGFIAYWLVCFAFTVLAIFTALLDLLIIRRRSRKARRELLERTLGEFGSTFDEPRLKKPRVSKPPGSES